MQQLNLQLYGRPGDGGFTEQLSAFRSVMLAPDRQTIALTLDAPAGHPLAELRLDPDDKPSTFLLHGLVVRSTSGAELWRWDGNPDSLGAPTELRLFREHGETVAESLGNDPFLLIALPEPQAEGVVVELCASQALPAAFGDDSVAEALRSLRTSLRAAIDELAAEQEGLQDALAVHHAHARSEARSVADRVAKVEAEFAKALIDTRKLMLAEVRDDWRSVRQQIVDAAETAERQARERQAETAAVFEGELARIAQAVNRLASSAAVAEQVRDELQVARDADAIPALQRLRAESDAARARLRVVDSSLSWRMTRPFRALSGLFRAPRRP